ncbi:MAG: peptidoglycan-binding domain-containing protein [Candidatus Acidiferrales bacterium]
MNQIRIIGMLCFAALACMLAPNSRAGMKLAYVRVRPHKVLRPEARRIPPARPGHSSPARRTPNRYAVLPVSASSSSAARGPQQSSSKRSSHKRRARRRRNHSRVRLQKAPTPERISEIQSSLSRGGYYQGQPNGKWDSSTVGALQKFQSTHGLQSTGKLDALTLQKMGLGSDIAGVSAPRPIMPQSTIPPPASAPKANPSSTPVPSAVHSPETPSSASSAVPSPRL